MQIKKAESPMNRIRLMTGIFNSIKQHTLKIPPFSSPEKRFPQAFISKEMHSSKGSTIFASKSHVESTLLPKPGAIQAPQNG